MAVWGNNLVEPFQRLAESYHEIHPEVRVEVELQAGQGYDMWMAIQMISKSPPEIMQSQWYWSWQYAEKDKVIQVDKFLDEVNPYTEMRWRDQFFQARLNSVRDPRGKLYIIPHDQVKTAMFYNKKIFDQLGLSPPSTWKEFMEICQRIKDAEYVPVGVPNVSTSGIVGWNVNVFFDSVYHVKLPQLDVLRADGFVDKEESIRGYVKGVFDPFEPRYQEIWKIFKDWSRFWQRGFNASSEADVGRLFLDSKVAMVMNGCWAGKYLREDIKDLIPRKRFQFGIFPLPNITEETSPYFNVPLGSVGSVGIGYVIPKCLSEDKVAVTIDWLRFLITPKNVERCGSELNLPCIKGVRLPQDFDGFIPLIDGTFPDFRILEGSIFPDQRCQDEWFRYFQGYMGDKLSLNEFSRKLKSSIEAGIKRIMDTYKYDTSKW